MSLKHVRTGYLALQLRKIAIYYYVSRITKRKNDHTVLEYVEPVSSTVSSYPIAQQLVLICMQSQENEKEEELTTITVYDHDLDEISYLGCLPLRSAPPPT
ncbi:hypothetical protein GALMADRAFT_144795 [Galerina marginata CBS 339.88]|uniref:Uncharacterized protein n=1 Tax=Galerina marginata (strain CBS 339.88) TaxID=685588 RepID=A0A067SS82_GALM3|nr:hypothetical protein GALMADRAFT_144795 [Galerina marginata CBS 339.88]